jgi:hypothetical protein
MRSLCYLLLLIVLGLSPLVVDARPIPETPMTTVSSCTLNCENEGYCEFVPGDQNVLKILVQSGQMIQRCVCPEGYTGMGCEQKCEQDEAGVYHCDCSIADSLSPTAARMCRHTYTEYCGVEYNPKRPLSFCTNGGKCKAGLIAARVAPGNTTFNAKYENAGCICPLEYYGPHCELMHNILTKTTVSAPSQVTSIPTKPTANSSSPPSVEDIINKFNDFNSTNPDDGQKEQLVSQGTNSTSSLLLKVLLSVLFTVGAVCTTLGVMLYRHRQQKHRSILRKKHTPRKKLQALADKKRSDAPTRSKAVVLRPSSELGSADLAPFVVDTSDDGEGTMHTESWGSQSGNNETASGGDDSGSWIETISNRIDSFVGANVSTYIVDDCDQGAAYVVDDSEDDDEDTSDNNDVDAAYLDRYRHQQPYVVDDDDDDIYSVGTAWEAASTFRPDARFAI